MDILKNFMKEAGAAPTGGTGEPHADAVAATQTGDSSSRAGTGGTGVAGQLLVAGCVEWDQMTSKSPPGLSGPHYLPFPSLVKKAFSSSSSPFAFVLLQDGSLYAMGCNDHGQLGLGDTLLRKRPTLVRTSFPSPVVKVATGRYHTLALLENGEVYASGANASGQCGLGSNSRARDFTEFTRVEELRRVVDVACGWEHSLACTTEGRLYTFGHPSYGQLGNGTTGEFIKESQRVSFDFVSTPFMVSKFVSKDRHGSVRAEHPAASVHVARVAAGRNHSLCVEAPASADEATGAGSDAGGSGGQCGSRVFTWGFGGYGRLGHNSADNELRPRELEFFSKTERQPRLDSKVVVEATCGSSFTVVVTKSKHIYFFGKMSNSPRGEATMYPKLQQELFDWRTASVAAGSNLIVTSSADETPETVAWGQPIAGKIGLEGDASSTSAPKYVDRLGGARCIDVSCGYGHVCYLVTREPSVGPSDFPEFPHAVDCGTSASASSEGAQKKRKAPAGGSGAAKRKG